jgi:hypothetical protein
MKKFTVTGHAFVPVKVKIVMEAASPEEAMKAANKKLKTGIRDHVVAGTDDDGAAWGFDAFDAEEATEEEIEDAARKAKR